MYEGEMIANATHVTIVGEITFHVKSCIVFVTLTLRKTSQLYVQTIESIVSIYFQ